MPLSLTGKQWVMDEHGVTASSAFTDQLIKQRHLLNPPLDRICAFRGAARTIDRIGRAIQSQEQIGIFGDYDCDGITAGALLVRFFERRGIHPLLRLPKRSEGYGLHKHQIDEFCRKKVSLLIMVDTGITATESVQYANKHHIDVLIIDHHTIPNVLPPTDTIIHPHLADPALLPEPSAAGLCYLLVRALEGAIWNDHLTDIALAGLGTIADLVTLKGLNRTIAHDGLTAWNKILTGPLHELKRSAGLQTVTGTDIAFRLAPRINAAGRLDDPTIALTALLKGGDAIAALEQLNKERQTHVADIYDSLTNIEPSPCVCIADERYHPGIIGLLAAKLTERFYRPSLVGHICNGICTASLRSIPGVNIIEILKQCEPLLINFGGHAQAAGCTFEYTNFPTLRENLSQAVSRSLCPSASIPALLIDATLSPNDVTLEFCEDLRRLEPFGQGNPEPRFLLRNIHTQEGRCVGDGGKHLQCSVGHIKAIGFGLGNLLSYISRPLDFVCRLSINQWNGNKRPQLFIDDLRLSKNSCPNERVSWAPLVQDTV